MAPTALPAKLAAYMPADREPDRAERGLAARLRRREPRAVEELHARYGGMVLGYLTFDPGRASA